MTTTIDGLTGERRSDRSERARRAGAPWRFALRLARREVRRRPGRTLLVMLLIAVPVCGMTVVTVLVRTNTDSVTEGFARQFGAADLVDDTASIARAGTGGAGASTQAAFPAGTRTVSFYESDVQGLVGVDGTARLSQVVDLDLSDPIAHGTVLLRSGRFPSRAGEALLSPKLARAFGVNVGDTLRLAQPKWTETIVGIGVRSSNWSDGFLDVRGNELTAVAAAVGSPITGSLPVGRLTLVDLPGHPSDAELLSYPGYISPASFSLGTADRAVNWVLVGGIVGLAIIGIVISGAFAVGARRQLVTLGQLSANGADERLLRRTLSLQGLVTGAIGSAVGFTAGVAVLLLLRGQFETWIHHDPGPYLWSARDAVAILLTGAVTATVAAFVPARSAARVPVLTALAGRRPLGTLPKRLVPIGAALFAGGVFVLVLVATASGGRGGDGLALSAVFGGLLVLAGACCASSVVVALLGNVARSARGSARVAIRSVVRSRARSAAVVMALAAINAGAIAVGTALDSHTFSKSQNVQFMPDDTLIVTNGGPVRGIASSAPVRGIASSAPVRGIAGVGQYRPVSPSVLATLHKILPDAQWNVRRGVVGGGNSEGLPLNADAVLTPSIVTVADPAVLQMLGLSARDSAALERLGVITVRADPDRQGKRPLTAQVAIGNASAHVVTAAVAQDSVRGTGEGGGVFMTEAEAGALKVPIVETGEIVHNPKPFDESQRASIDAFSQSMFLNGAVASSTNILWSGTGNRVLSVAAVRQIVLGIVVLIALLVLAMSLALSAAETRDERDVLVSLGARPATMRSVSAWKAGMLAVSGALVAIPTGFIPVAVVYLAVAKPGEGAHIAFPWLTVLELVIAAPILAGLVAYAGSTIAQAVRPTRMSTFATD